MKDKLTENIEEEIEDTTKLEKNKALLEKLENDIKTL